MLRSSESVRQESDSCSVSDTEQAGEPSGAQLSHPADVQIETELNQNNSLDGDKTDNSELFANKSSPLFELDNSLPFKNEACLERRYSSVDIPGISIKVNNKNDQSSDSEYSLMPNGMVVRTMPDRKRLFYHGSQYSGSRGRLCRSKGHLDDNSNMQREHFSRVIDENRLCNSHPQVAHFNTIKENQKRNIYDKDSSLLTDSIPRDNNRNPISTGAQKFSKEELYIMWKVSEKELKKQLEDALQENKALQQKLSQLAPDER